MILQRLSGVEKKYRKYFRLRAKNYYSIFHRYLKCPLKSKIVRISWKFVQRWKVSQIIIIYEKKIFINFSPTQNVIPWNPVPVFKSALPVWLSSKNVRLWLAVSLQYSYQLNSSIISKKIQVSIEFGCAAGYFFIFFLRNLDSSC